MPDVVSQQSSSSFGDRRFRLASSKEQPDFGSSTSRLQDKNVLSPKRSQDSSRPEVIQELSEPASPSSMSPTQHSPPSSLSEMFRKSHDVDEEVSDWDGGPVCGGEGVQPVVVGEGIISQPTEQTELLLKKAACGFENERYSKYGSMQDVEGQKEPRANLNVRIKKTVIRIMKEGTNISRRISRPKSWDKRAVWVHGVREPASYIPSVILGVLLNVLDALSYGK